MWSNIGCVLLFSIVCSCMCVKTQAKIDSEEDTAESAGERDKDSNITQSTVAGIISFSDSDRDTEDSGEHIGAAVTQVYHHPYAASLLKNEVYVCSAIILNTYWMLTLSKCFDSNVISSYVTQKNLGNYTLRVGSSYNNKSGSISQIYMLLNNFDLKVSAIKLHTSLQFSSRVRSVNLPEPDEEANLGYLVSILAWTPTGHMRVLNAPLIDSSICESSTKLLPGHYICVGGVQDPNRHFCRRDDGGAVIQNNKLIAVASFLHTCAVYTRTHAFPKVSSFARWLDTIIWDEDNRPTTPKVTTYSNKPTLPSIINITETASDNRNLFFPDPRKMILSLPFDPISVPLEPAEDNSVLPRMSLYESYLQSLAKGKTTSTQNPNTIDDMKIQREWLRKYGKSLMYEPKKYQPYGFN